ncbi:TlpA family protein disulfide reductase [Alicyclobacillus mali (ex Roth et al. 2021)]|uniref:TlpA family protein disulfide reductase n=1 Tax=Alicyclobacillus mali (ex Roth et al. 2021) TaxID=1123961 RepID=UPI003242098D
MSIGLSGCGLPSSKSASTHAGSPNAAVTGRGQEGAVHPGNATAPTSAGQILVPGAMAPDVLLTAEPSGKRVPISAYLGKKPVVLNAWASWCPPCREETPQLVSMYRAYGTKVQFLGVNLTSLDSVPAAETFIRRYHIPYPVLFDTQGDFDRAYSVIAEPMTYVINQQGRVVSIHVGALSGSALRAVMEQALASR